MAYPAGARAGEAAESVRKVLSKITVLSSELDLVNEKFKEKIGKKNSIIQEHNNEINSLKNQKLAEEQKVKKSEKELAKHRKILEHLILSNQQKQSVLVRQIELLNAKYGDLLNKTDEDKKKALQQHQEELFNLTQKLELAKQDELKNTNAHIQEKQEIEEKWIEQLNKKDLNIQSQNDEIILLKKEIQEKVSELSLLNSKHQQELNAKKLIIEKITQENEQAQKNVLLLQKQIEDQKKALEQLQLKNKEQGELIVQQSTAIENAKNEAQKAKTEKDIEIANMQEQINRAKQDADVKVTQGTSDDALKAQIVDLSKAAKPLSEEKGIAPGRLVNWLLDKIGDTTNKDQGLGNPPTSVLRQLLSSSVGESWLTSPQSNDLRGVPPLAMSFTDFLITQDPTSKKTGLQIALERVVDEKKVGQGQALSPLVNHTALMSFLRRYAEETPEFFKGLAKPEIESAQQLLLSKCDLDLQQQKQKFEQEKKQALDEQKVLLEQEANNKDATDEQFKKKLYKVAKAKEGDWSDPWKFGDLVYWLIAEGSEQDENMSGLGLAFSVFNQLASQTKISWMHPNSYIADSLNTDAGYKFLAKWMTRYGEYALKEQEFSNALRPLCAKDNPDPSQEILSWPPPAQPQQKDKDPEPGKLASTLLTTDNKEKAISIVKQLMTDQEVRNGYFTSDTVSFRDWVLGTHESKSGLEDIFDWFSSYQPSVKTGFAINLLNALFPTNDTSEQAKGIFDQWMKGGGSKFVQERLNAYKDGKTEGYAWVKDFTPAEVQKQINTLKEIKDLSLKQIASLKKELQDQKSTNEELEKEVLNLQQLSQTASQPQEITDEKIEEKIQEWLKPGLQDEKGNVTPGKLVKFLVKGIDAQKLSFNDNIIQLLNQLAIEPAGNASLNAYAETLAEKKIAESILPIVSKDNTPTAAGRLVSWISTNNLAPTVVDQLALTDQGKQALSDWATKNGFVVEKDAFITSEQKKKKQTKGELAALTTEIEETLKSLLEKITTLTTRSQKEFLRNSNISEQNGFAFLLKKLLEKDSENEVLIGYFDEKWEEQFKPFIKNFVTKSSVTYGMDGSAYHLLELLTQISREALDEPKNILEKDLEKKEEFKRSVNRFFQNTNSYQQFLQQFCVGTQNKSANISQNQDTQNKNPAINKQITEEEKKNIITEAFEEFEELNKSLKPVQYRNELNNNTIAQQLIKLSKKKDDDGYKPGTLVDFLSKLEYKDSWIPVNRGILMQFLNSTAGEHWLTAELIEEGIGEMPEDEIPQKYNLFGYLSQNPEIINTLIEQKKYLPPQAQPQEK